jgi:hypothetical protein
LVIIPASQNSAQSVVLGWAGFDTEFQPDMIWTAPEALDVWDPEMIAAWCRSKDAWSDMKSVLPLPVERIVVMFDGDVYCAISANASKSVLETLREMADAWNIKL